VGNHHGYLPKSSVDQSRIDPIVDQGRPVAGRSPASLVAILPRFVRLRDAPAFFGMDKNRFNREVRPHLTEIRIGTQGR